MIRLTAIAAAAVLLAGCATTAPKPLPASAYCPKPDPQMVCTGWAPIITHADDLKLMDQRTIQEIDAHNNYGVSRGCWKQGGRA